MIILVTGLPGSGKSFFAEKLATKLGAIYINSDQVRSNLHKSGKYSLEDKLVIYREMLAQADHAIDKSLDVVLDATFFNHAMRDMFIHLADACMVPVRVIEITADENLIRQRLGKPRKYSEADFTVYEKIRDEFEEITMPHLILESTNDNLNVMLDRATNYINSAGK